MRVYEFPVICDQLESVYLITMSGISSSKWLEYDWIIVEKSWVDEFWTRDFFVEIIKECREPHLIYPLNINTYSSNIGLEHHHIIVYEYINARICFDHLNIIQLCPWGDKNDIDLFFLFVENFRFSFKC